MNFNDEHEPRMPRRLPVVEIDGKHFFKDERLAEYRNVDNPHDRITFEEYADRPF